MGLLQRMSGKPKQEAPPAHWPTAGEVIWARLPCCEAAVHPTRVADVSGETLVIVAPLKPHVQPIPPPEEGATFMIGWREGGASKQLKVEFSEGREQPVPSWRVKPVAEPKVVQRRDYVRAAWDQPAEFTFGIRTVEGKILDISEGGLRCVLPEMEEPRQSRFEVSFELESGAVTLEAEISWWSQPMEKMVQVGLSFLTEDQALRDRLRAQAYGLQLEQRRRGLPDV